jgi:hypothetical protein
MRRRGALKILVTALCAGLVTGSLAAQQPRNPSQSAVAARNVKFATVAKADREYREARDAKDLAGAGKLIGKRSAFRGTVAKVFAPRSGNLVILNFAADYKTAITGVVKQEDFARFPDLQALQGREVLLSGPVVDYQGRPEVVLSRPEQVKIVK